MCFMFRFILFVFGLYICDAQFKAIRRPAIPYSERLIAPDTERSYDERLSEPCPETFVVRNPERSVEPNSKRPKPLVVRVDTRIDIYDEYAPRTERNRCDGSNEVWYPDGHCGEDCDTGFRCYVNSLCFCKAGFKRKGGICVSQCPSDTACPKSMLLSYCPRCVEYCDPRDTTEQPRCDRSSRKPNVLCEEGRQYCTCPTGWKWFNGSCVFKCPQEMCTEDGLVYHNCYNHNWQKCPYYAEATGTMRERHCYPGCFCPEGTYYFQGRCIEQLFCPIGEKKCNRLMEYRVYANPCSRSCSRLLCSTPCPPLAQEGCFCAQGTYWNDMSKECVNRLQCFSDIVRKPLVSQPKSMVGFCASSTEEFKCGYSNMNYCPEGDFARESKVRDCIPGCFCIENHWYSKRDENCVPKSDCPRVRCPPNSLLQTKCIGFDICYFDLKPDCQPVPSCFCKPGYKRQSIDGTECLEENKCKASP